MRRNCIGKLEKPGELSCGEQGLSSGDVVSTEEHSPRAGAVVAIRQLNA
jgi:hypothetical protein